MSDIRLTCIVHSMFVQRSYCIVCCSRPINLIRIQCNAAWRRMHYRERTCILSQKSTNNIDFTTACVAVSLLHDCACTALRRWATIRDCSMDRKDAPAVSDGLWCRATFCVHLLASCGQWNLLEYAASWFATCIATDYAKSVPLSWQSCRTATSQRHPQRLTWAMNERSKPSNLDCVVAPTCARLRRRCHAVAPIANRELGTLWVVRVHGLGYSTLCCAVEHPRPTRVTHMLQPISQQNS